MIGNRLKKFVDENFKFNKDFANNCGISNTQLSNWINGQRSPGVDLLAILWREGLSIDWLISGTGSMFALNEKGERLKDIHSEKYYKELAHENYLIREKQPIYRAELKELTKQINNITDIASDLKKKINKLEGE